MWCSTLPSVRRLLQELVELPWAHQHATRDPCAIGAIGRRAMPDAFAGSTAAEIAQKAHDLALTALSPRQSVETGRHVDRAFAHDRMLGDEGDHVHTDMQFRTMSRQLAALFTTLSGRAAAKDHAKYGIGLSTATMPTLATRARETPVKTTAPALCRRAPRRAARACRWRT